MTRFDACLPYVLRSEGGNSDDLHDPGGRTHNGITQREYDAYRQLKNLSVQDVYGALDAEVRNIYSQFYWMPWCDKLSSGLDYLFFDMSVLQGVHQATLLLQRALGVTADGHIGAITLGALANASPSKLIVTISSSRRGFFLSLPGFRYFGRGWLNRVNSVEFDALAMRLPRV